MVNETEIRFALAKKQNGPLSSQSISRMECAAGEELARDAEGRTRAEPHAPKASRRATARPGGR